MPQPPMLPPRPNSVPTTSVPSSDVQDQNFAGVLKANNMPIPFSELSPNAGENLTPPVTRDGGTMGKLPEWNRPSGPSSPAANSQKKELLQKLISTLMSKPGRSMHEMINGVKDVLSTYKNFSKEWDNLHGAVQQSSAPAGGSSRGSAEDVQGILRGIQQKKDGAGGPGTSTGYAAGGPGYFDTKTPTQRNSNQLPQTPQPPQPIHQLQPATTNLIAGQPQNSTFSKSAPVNRLGVWGY
jgi:hypothetical protein